MARIVGLHHFQIKGDGSPDDRVTCPVYQNCLQQIQVEIVISAYDAAGQIVPLTLGQMAGVRLIDYSDGSVFDPFLLRLYVKNATDFYGGARSSEAGSVNQNMSKHTFFISVKPGVLHPKKQLAAELELDGATYRTNHHTATPGGAYNSGGFNSSIILHPVIPYVLRADQFLIKVDDSILPIGSGLHGIFVKWEISLLNPDLKIIGSDIPQTPIHLFALYANEGRWHAKHWALPVNDDPAAKITLRANWSGEHILDVVIAPYTKPGVAYAVMELASNLTGPVHASKEIRYIDNNGCGHTVYLVATNDGVNFELHDNP